MSTLYSDPSLVTLHDPNCREVDDDHFVILPTISVAQYTSSGISLISLHK
jgi:hypothetical protein